MASFKDHYRSLFEMLGYPLTERCAVPVPVITAAERQLGVRLPAALRDYYLVAGRERRFNHCHNHLLPPREWAIDKQRLLLMAENQGALWWAVSVRNPKSDDPSVYQGIDDEPIAWYLEHRKCSIFLTVMLHYHAVNRGLPFCGSADVPDETDYRFEDNGWTFHGEVNSLRAYSRPKQVVCFMPPAGLPFALEWSVLAGAKSKAGLKAIGDEIGVALS